MRRQLLIPGLALSLLLTALSACAAETDGPRPWTYRIETVREQIERHGTTAAQIRLEKPLFSGAQAVDGVNEWLSFYQELKLADFMDYAAQRLDDMEFNGETLEDRIYYYIEESCNIFHNDGLFLSIVLDKLTVSAGEPHPTTYRYAYNFDAATGEALALEDIWGEQAREKAAREVCALIESEGRLDKYYEDLAYLLRHGFDPDCWYMDDKNIHIIYNPYVIAPYAAGVQEFSLPK
ncbi:MAG: RsiV family protein [Clostridiales bacterium]|nr:RsiV family protein [Clostridiales bacterium]